MTFDEIYKNYRGPIQGYLTRMTTVEVSEDLTQEVFAKVAKGLPAFKGRARVSTWIYRIATNTAIDWRRGKNTPYPDEPLVDVLESLETADVAGQTVKISEPLQQVIHMEMNACIREQVDKLPEKYRTVMILNSLDELDNKEIAAILDISIDAAKIRLHRARAMLKKILRAQCQFYRNPSTGALACDRKTPSRC